GRRRPTSPGPSRFPSRPEPASRRPLCIPSRRPPREAGPRTMLASPSRRYGDHLQRCRILGIFTRLGVLVVFVVLAAQLVFAPAQVGLPLAEHLLVLAPAPGDPPQELRIVVRSDRCAGPLALGEA